MGIPLEGLTGRSKEKIAMALLAAGDIKSSSDWSKVKSTNSGYSVTTKQCIEFYNSYLDEDMSLGSYDYVLRDGLRKLIIGGIVDRSKPQANISDATRGYRVSTEYAKIIKKFGEKDWEKLVESFNKTHKTYRERIEQKRDLPKIPVVLPDGRTFELTDGEHNMIQQQIITEFLPRHGHGAMLLYCGDADNKYGIIYEKEKLESLGIKDIAQNKLPDIIAYSEKEDWIFLIEAYHTSNPITPERKYELEIMLGDAARKCCFVTAFENQAAYRSCPEDLAWETEVWVATQPDHMIHLNGSRFQGPYERSNKVL